MLRSVLERDNFIDNWEMKSRTAVTYDANGFSLNYRKNKCSSKAVHTILLP